MDPDFQEIKRRYRQQIWGALKDWPQQSMRVRPADSYGPLQQDECWSPVPTRPADADVDANMNEAAEMWPNPVAFRDTVKDGAKWDYKRRARRYENFGNFNYGATGTAWGFPAEFLKWMAGRAQLNRNTSTPEWQKYGGLLPPYGDDPVDQEWIERGIEYAKKGGKRAVVCR